MLCVAKSFVLSVNVPNALILSDTILIIVKLIAIELFKSKWEVYILVKTYYAFIFVICKYKK
jgi:hypothetical protein